MSRRRFVVIPDPTLEGAQAKEIEEKRCAVCLHRGIEVFDGVFTCSKDKKWLRDRARCPAFKLDQ